MKTKLIASTLGLIALAGVAATSSIAYANDWDDDDNRNTGYSESEDNRAGFSMSQLREGFRYARIVNDRQDRQLDEIIAGVANNRLSKNEFLNLMQEQKNIRAMERGFMDDRFMNESEFRKLNRSLDIADRNIRIAKQNGHSQRYSSSRPAWTIN